MITRARAGLLAVHPALALLAFIAFIAQVGIAVMLPLLPLFATELGATPFVLGLLTSAFAVTNGLGQLGVGVLSDRLGARRFIGGGLALYAGGNALIATAASATWLLAWRTLSGFGGGALIVSQRIYLAEITAPDRRAFANGILSAAASAGSVAGPAFGGFIAAVGGLRAPFVVVAVTSAIAFVASLALPHGRPQSFTAESADAPAVEEPVDRGGVIALLFANLAMLAGYGAFITTYAPLATERLGWTTVDVGLTFSFFGAGSILLGPPIAHLADRTSRRAVAIGGIVPVAAFGLALVMGLPIWAVFGVAVLAGAGLTAFNASWYAMLADVSGTRARGRIFGIVSAVSNVGIVIGATTAAQLWERVDLVAAMGSGVVATLLAVVPMLAFRAARR
ncbi:MAG: MFS transporter [Chloroflexi bacterium]|nr:MFS transporter [Chloroflexota bacterium]